MDGPIALISRRRSSSSSSSSASVGLSTSIGALVVLILIIIAAGIYFTTRSGLQPTSIPSISTAGSSSAGQLTSNIVTEGNGTSGSTGVGSTSVNVSSNGPAHTANVSIVAGAAKDVNSTGYSPDTITVVIGVNNTVTWTNHDSAIHTVTAMDKSFDSGDIAPGQSFTHTFTTAGNFSYTCNYHSWMKGIVVVIVP